MLFFAVFVAFFRAKRVPFGAALRERDLLRAFRQAGPLQYVTIVLLRSPAMLGAFWVYSAAAGLFGVEVSVGQMLGLLPAIFVSALLPLPGRPGPVLLWTLFFPEHVAQMTALRDHPAQRLRALQRGDRAAVPAAREPRAVRGG